MIPLVSVIILAWDNRADTCACLASLQKLEYANFQIILVDNASTDNTLARVRADFPDVHCIANATNLGFVEGNNVGIRYALEHDAAYIFLLNDDTVLASPHLLVELVRVGESDPQIGMLTPSIVSYHDRSKRYWGARLDWEQGTGIEDDRQVTQVSNTDFAQGCALLVKARIVREIGLLNPAYWAYFEDADWSLRCKHAGYRVVVVPQATIFHKGTSDQIAQKSATAFYFFRRNQVLFMRRHTSPIQQMRFFRTYVRDCILHYRQLRANDQHDQANATVDGWWAGMCGQFGARRVQAPAWFRHLIHKQGMRLIALTNPRTWFLQRWSQWKTRASNN